jgi:hypothetical protein
LKRKEQKDMIEPTIVCPHCHTEIKLTKALAGPLLEQAESNFISALEKQKRDSAVALIEERLRIGKEEQVLARQEAARDLEKKDRALKELENELAKQDEKLAEAQKAQADALRKGRELDAAKREMDLQVEKKIQEGLSAARTEAEDKVKLKVMERDSKIAELQKHIDDLKQRAEQGDQRLQGEVQELDIENLLRTAFPFDLIEPVAKGVSGGDIIQTVRTDTGKVCGKILWESKRTKHWSDGWLEKLRSDQRTAQAEIAVIVSQALPPSVGVFGMIDGVCVCGTAEKVFLPVSVLLRDRLIQIARAQVAAEGQQTKAELVYQYLTGPRFKQRIEAIVEAFTGMQEDLDKEIKVISKQWASRRAQITNVMASTVGMYGDLQGIAGKSLQEVNGLQLEAIGDK